MYRVLKPFEFFEPTSLDEAIRLLNIYDDRAKVLTELNFDGKMEWGGGSIGGLGKKFIW